MREPAPPEDTGVAIGDIQSETDTQFTAGLVRPSSGRSSSRREAFESALLDAAAELFATRGYAGTTLQDVADALGVSRPALYHYVSSKDDLVAKIARDTLANSAFVINMPENLASRPDLRLKKIMMGTVEAALRHPERTRLVSRSETNLPPEVSRLYKEIWHGFERTVESTIADGIRCGLFHPVDEAIAARALSGMVLFASWWYQPGGSTTVVETGRILSDMAVRSLLRQNPTDGHEDAATAVLDRIKRDLQIVEQMLAHQPGIH